MNVLIPLLILFDGRVLRLDLNQHAWVPTTAVLEDVLTDNFRYLELTPRNAFVKKTGQSLRIGRFEILPTGDLRTRWCLPIPAKDTAVLTVSSDFKQVVIEQNRAVSLLRLRGTAWEKKRLFVMPVENRGCSASFDALNRRLCVSIQFSKTVMSTYSKIRVLDLESPTSRVLYRGQAGERAQSLQPYKDGWSMHGEDTTRHTLLRPGRVGYELQVRLGGRLGVKMSTVTESSIQDSAGNVRLANRLFVPPVAGNAYPVALDDKTVLWGSHAGGSFWLNNKPVACSQEGVVLFALQSPKKNTRTRGKGL